MYTSCSAVSRREGRKLGLSQISDKNRTFSVFSSSYNLSEAKVLIKGTPISIYRWLWPSYAPSYHTGLSLLRASRRQHARLIL